MELDHELTDVFPAARDLLYHIIDTPSHLSSSELIALIASAGIDTGDVARVIDFLLYYGILGVRTSDEQVHYIFNVNYDLKVLQIRALRAADVGAYVMNPAFRPALGIKDSD